MKVSLRRKIVVAVIAVAATVCVWLGGPATWETAPPAARPLASTDEPAIAGHDEANALREVIRQVLANDRHLTAFMHYFDRSVLSEVESCKGKRQ